MKLYYAPGVCSLAPHIVLREVGAAFELVKVDLKSKTIAGGGSLLEINPKGYVPVLQIDANTRLTEGPAIMQYIADRYPAAGLAPANGTLERYRVQEWLNFISTELHKGFSPLFNAGLGDEAKAVHKAKLAERLTWLDEQMAGRDFLMGAAFTIADAYAYTVLNWSRAAKIELAAWPALKAFHGRVARRPLVQCAMRAEGLLK